MYKISYKNQTQNAVTVYNNNNNNKQDNVYSAVIMTQSHCKSSPGSCNECRTAPNGCRPLDQANGLELQARL